VTGARSRLAAEQAALLRALLAGGPTPPGFDEHALRVEADALLAKRRRVVAQLAPEVAGELEERYRPLFDEYARAHPRTVGSRARDDATAFTAWLVTAGHVTEPKRRWWRRT
jgi:hypothetical protein